MLQGTCNAAVSLHWTQPGNPWSSIQHIYPFNFPYYTQQTLEPLLIFKYSTVQNYHSTTQRLVADKLNNIFYI